MRRRTLLAGCSTVLAGVVAGCGGDGDADGGATPGSDTPAETPTPADTATPAETETPTDTATPTGTPSGAVFTHELGEEFTVGEGDDEVGYRIIELFRADEVGNSVNNAAADGTFLIVVLEFINPQDDVVSFPRGDFRVQREGSWRRFDRQGTEKLNSDERLNVEQIGDETVSSGQSVQGAVAFDVDPDREYRVWITPMGDADTPEHFVPVGEISSVQELQGSLTG